jgi:hypothetical protein
MKTLSGEICNLIARYQSALELETAVRLESNLVHMILIDGSYDMVAEQEILKYGRPSGTDFGPVDPVNYAEAFGAKGTHDPITRANSLCVETGIRYSGSSSCRSSRRRPRQLPDV